MYQHGGVAWHIPSERASLCTNGLDYVIFAAFASSPREVDWHLVQDTLTFVITALHMDF